MINCNNYYDNINNKNKNNDNKIKQQYIMIKLRLMIYIFPNHCIKIYIHVENYVKQS